MHPLIDSKQFQSTGARDATDAADAIDAHWYAIQTKPRAEEKTLGFLSLKCIPTFMPRVLVRRRHGSRKWEALEPLFPAYLFARFEPQPQMIDRVRWTPGVKKLLGDEEQPVPVPSEVISYLQDCIGERGYVAPGPAFSSGMRVRFRSGPFALLEGIIHQLSSRSERVRVLLELLNRPVFVEVDTCELEPIRT